MFMSTVVHFVEFIMVSLTVIMLYKLYTTYKNWVTVSVFSAKSAIKKDSVAIKPKEENNFSNVESGHDSDYLSANKICVSEVESKLVAQEIKPASILDDYIGGFFTETTSVDIDAYRSDESVLPTSVLPKAVEPLSSECSPKSEPIDDVIKVQHSTLHNTLVINKDSDLIEQGSPKLKDFSDMEADSFITVASVNDEQKDNNKVMSDKVVLAMLDEAKLVCAS